MHVVGSAEQCVPSGKVGDKDNSSVSRFRGSVWSALEEDETTVPLYILLLLCLVAMEADEPPQAD